MDSDLGAALVAHGLEATRTICCWLHEQVIVAHNLEAALVARDLEATRTVICPGLMQRMGLARMKLVTMA